MESNTNSELQKSLNPMNVWALALGAIIGFGCFILPPDFLEKAGPLGVVLGLSIGAIAMAIVGKSISFMVEQYPVAGGMFAFAYRSFGRTHGFICGWMLSLCYISLIAMNATALGVLAQYLAPGFFTRGLMYSVAGWNVYLPQLVLSELFVLLFAYFNLKGGEIAGGIQLGMVLLMICAVLLIVFGTVFSDAAAFENLKPAFPSGISGSKAILSMVALAPWLFVGFDTIPHSAEEFKFSSRKTFLLVLASIVVGALIYSAVAICTAMVWPWEEMVAERYAWATGTAMESSIGMIGVVFLAVAICMGIFTGMNGFYLSSSRLLLDMSRENILGKWFGKISDRYHTPTNSIYAAMVICLIMPFFGRKAIGWVVDMCSCSTAIAYLYSCIAAQKAYKRIKSEGGVPNISSWVPIVGMICSIGILGLLLIPGTPGSMGIESWVCLIVWAVLGIGFYQTAKKKGF